MVEQLCKSFEKKSFNMHAGPSAAVTYFSNGPSDGTFFLVMPKEGNAVMRVDIGL